MTALVTPRGPRAIKSTCCVASEASNGKGLSSVTVPSGSRRMRTIILEDERMLRISVTLVGILLLLNQAAAQSITIEGDLEHGAEIVVRGQGFGSGDGIQHVVYDNFERSSISNNATVGAWRTTNLLQIVNHSRHPKATRAAYHDFVGGGTAGVGTSNSVLSRKWFAQHWVKLENWSWGTTGYDGNNRHLANVKVVRFWNPGSESENYVSATRTGSNGAVFSQAENVSDSYGNTNLTKNMMSDGSWHLLQYEFADSSSPGSSDGVFRVWFDGRLVGDRSGFVARTNNNLKRIFLLGFYNSWSPGSGESNDGPNHFYMHDAYTSPTWARVEIGDAPIYANCTVREIQVPISWSDDQIRLRVNQGSFANNASAYLFVVDANGNPLPGRSIVFGEGEALPKAPESVTVE